MTLDEMFEGTFDLVAKSDRTSVETRAGVAKASAASDDEDSSASEGGGMSGLWAKWLSEDRSTTTTPGSSTGLGERRLEYDHEGYGRKMGWSGYGERPAEAGGSRGSTGDGGAGGTGGEGSSAGTGGAGNAGGGRGSWGSTSRVEVVSSLSPVVLVLDGPG